eukprot:3264276-Pyramimonas_sp.AAC.1
MRLAMNKTRPDSTEKEAEEIIIFLESRPSQEAFKRKQENDPMDVDSLRRGAGHARGKAQGGRGRGQGSKGKSRDNGRAPTCWGRGRPGH